MKNRAKEMTPPSDAWSEPLPFAGAKGDDHAAADDGDGQRVDERLGQEAAFQVAVRELNQADKQKQRR